MNSPQNEKISIRVKQAKSKAKDAISAATRAEAKSRRQSEKLAAIAESMIQQGQAQKAIDAYAEAITLNPLNKENQASFGIFLRNVKLYDRAMECFFSALEIDQNYAAARSGLGVVLGDIGDKLGAIEQHGKAIAANPKLAEAHLNLGVTLQDVQRYPEAIICLERALHLKPALTLAKLWMGKCLVDTGKFAQAKEIFTAVGESRHQEFLMAIGVAFMRTGEEEKAIEYFDRATDVVSDKVGALINKASALRMLKRHGEAYQTLNAALAIDSSRAEIYYNLSFVLLDIGEWDMGWELYEWRTRYFPQMAANSPLHIPRWDGKASLMGKRVLVIAEQGMGDLVQFSRYSLDLLDTCGAKEVLLQTYPPLMPLLRGIDSRITVTDQEAHKLQADCYVLLMSLPHVMKTTIENVPHSSGYLHPDDNLVRKWTRLLDEAWIDRSKQSERTIHVGLVWSGNQGHANDFNRSMTLAALKPLFKIPGLAFDVIQKEMSEPDRQWLLEQGNTKVWSDELKSFADTAALISLLDTTITVDTSVAHIAGAIGAPFCMAVPYSPDPRWTILGNATPWYSKAKLYRQETRADWAQVIDSIATDLQQMTTSNTMPQRHERSVNLMAPPEDVTPTDTEPKQQNSANQSAKTIVTDMPSKETRCKVCGHSSSLWGVVDFNKNCEENRSLYLPLSGVPIYYHECTKCHLVFTTAMDSWTPQDFALHIYNDQYKAVDPDYMDARPRSLADVVGKFAHDINAKRVLDYGGGSGLTSRLLKDRGINAMSWDPIADRDTAKPQGQFDLVTCFEVFEHTPVPVNTLIEMLSFAQPKNGMVLFSTLTIDDIKHRDIGFWYISPRNGHITIHTKASLKALFDQAGWNLHHFSAGTHLAYVNKPAFLGK